MSTVKTQQTQQTQEEKQKRYIASDFIEKIHENSHGEFFRTILCRQIEKHFPESQGRRTFSKPMKDRVYDWVQHFPFKPLPDPEIRIEVDSNIIETLIHVMTELTGLTKEELYQKCITDGQMYINLVKSQQKRNRQQKGQVAISQSVYAQIFESYVRDLQKMFSFLRT